MKTHSTSFDNLYAMQRNGVLLLHEIEGLQPTFADSLKEGQQKVCATMLAFQDGYNLDQYAIVRGVKALTGLASSALTLSAKGVQSAGVSAHAVAHTTLHMMDRIAEEMRLYDASRHLTQRLMQSPQAVQMNRCADAARDFFFPVNVINGTRSLRVFPRCVLRTLGDWTFFLIQMQENRSTESDLAAELQASIKNIAAQCPELILASGEPEATRYKVELLASPEVNAFALPGGQMAFSEGLNRAIDDYYNKIEVSNIPFVAINNDEGTSDEKVSVTIGGITKKDIRAAILAHEMTHVAAGHAEARLIFAIFSLCVINGLLFLLDRWLSQPRKESETENAEGSSEQRRSAHQTSYTFLEHPVRSNREYKQSQAFKKELIARANLVSGVIRDFLLSKNSRTAEFEADLTSVYLLEKSGYNPLAALWVQEMFERKNGIPYFSFLNLFSSHPTSTERKTAILGAIAQLDKGQKYLNKSTLISYLSETTRKKSGIGFAIHNMSSSS